MPLVWAKTFSNGIVFLQNLQAVRDLAQSGGSMPKVINDWLKRATDPKRPPMTYAEGRDFYSNSTRLSADEFNRLTPVMKAQIGQFTSALNRSLGQAATSVGKGELYSDSMAQYANAAAIAKRAVQARDILIKKALPAAGLYEGYKILTDK
jgi:hypothetical protein